MKKSNNKIRLPDRILEINSSDKDFLEKWYPSRGLLNFPKSYRVCLYGPPGVGKTRVIKNIIIRAFPKFEKILVLHCTEEAKEYSDINAEVLTEIPEPNDEMFKEGLKIAFILDDTNLSDLDKHAKYKLNRLFGFVSSHKNVSLFTATQDFFSIPKTIRKTSNIFVCWRVLDLDQLNTIGRRAGLKKGVLDGLFNKLSKDIHDSIWIDTTLSSPAKLRFNGFIPIDEEGHKIERTDKI